MVKQFAEYMKNTVTLDWDAVNENRAAWNARWNRSIER
jgi:putative spermidine/putrescine transport system substrate-binding protein